MPSGEGGVPPALLSGPFTLAEAERRGFSRKKLTRDRFRHLFSGVYAARQLPNDHDLWVRAAAKILPGDAVFSHQTAARLHGVPVPDDSSIHASLVQPTSSWPRREHLRIHRTNSYEYETVQGRRVSTPARIFVELAESLGLVDLVIAGDHMLRHDLVEPRDLREMTVTAGKRRGIRLARRAASLVRQCVDSPMETRLRLLLVLAGLPPPVVNTEVELYDGQRTLRFRPDLHYPEERIAIEYDGDLHRTQPATWRRDHAVRRQLPHFGWEIYAYNATDIYRTPRTTVEQIHRALWSRKRFRIRGEVPAQLSDEVWLHFER